jgi:uncharacterized protein YciW
MLVYAEKLTRQPGHMVREDVEVLRREGFADEDILALAEVTAYYAYANRIADGLGVAVEPWVEAALEQESRREPRESDRPANRLATIPLR